jgi:nicotinamidase-related amidase
MKPVFHKDATIFGYYEGELFAGPIQGLFDFVDQDGPQTGIQARIVCTDIADTIATVRYEHPVWGKETAMTDQRKPYTPLNTDNSALVLVDHQVGLMTGVRDYETGELKHNVVTLAKTAKVLRIPTVVTTTARDSMWGPTFPELVEVVGGEHIIDRSSVNAWDDPKVAAAIEATGRKKLIFAGLSLEVCAAFPAITALSKGYDAYVAVDASGTFSKTKREAGLLRMQQAGVILSDYATLMIEILKDNASSLAGPVYGALDMPWATLVGQIATAYGK